MEEKLNLEDLTQKELLDELNQLAIDLIDEIRSSEIAITIKAKYDILKSIFELLDRKGYYENHANPLVKNVEKNENNILMWVID
jgi:hypothetical protein